MSANIRQITSKSVRVDGVEYVVYTYDDGSVYEVAGWRFDKTGRRRLHRVWAPIKGIPKKRTQAILDAAKGVQ